MSFLCTAVRRQQPCNAGRLQRAEELRMLPRRRLPQATMLLSSYRNRLVSLSGERMGHRSLRRSCRGTSSSPTPPLRSSLLR